MHLESDGFKSVVDIFADWTKVTTLANLYSVCCRFEHVHKFVCINWVTLLLVTNRLDICILSASQSVLRYLVGDEEKWGIPVEHRQSFRLNFVVHRLHLLDQKDVRPMLTA